MTAKDQRPKTENRSPIDWKSVRRVLVVRLRSIGDTVLATPSLIALRRFLPDARIDILLEDWVAPLLAELDVIDNVVAIGKGKIERAQRAWQLRESRYDVVFDLHGGTTSSLLSRATGARHRVGFSHYSYPALYTLKLSSSPDFWKRKDIHSAEQQLALIGFTGVPVDDRPRSRLAVSEDARRTLAAKYTPQRDHALIHPSSLFHTKQWSAENFGRVVEFLDRMGLEAIAVASRSERAVLEELRQHSRVEVNIADDLSLPEIVALASKAKLFVGNDSGIAHIAAAVNTPTVVIFGSSSRTHWRPWTDAPNEIVFNPFDCQPCPGYECKVYGEPHCIQSVTVDSVIAAIHRVLA